MVCGLDLVLHTGQEVWGMGWMWCQCWTSSASWLWVQFGSRPRLPLPTGASKQGWSDKASCAGCAQPPGVVCSSKSNLHVSCEVNSRAGMYCTWHVGWTDYVHCMLYGGSARCTHCMHCPARSTLCSGSGTAQSRPALDPGCRAGLVLVPCVAHAL